jgi:hypothetical protein
MRMFVQDNRIVLEMGSASEANSLCDLVHDLCAALTFAPLIAQSQSVFQPVHKSDAQLAQIETSRWEQAKRHEREKDIAEKLRDGLLPFKTLPIPPLPDARPKRNASEPETSTPK